jgi:type IV secretory pathway VirB4 component
MASPEKSQFGNSLDLVDIDEIRGNIVIMKDKSLKQIVMVGGVNFALKSELEQNIITQGYQTFLNGIDFPLQIVLHSRKVNIDHYIQGLLARKDSEDSPLLKNQIDEYAEFIKGFVQKNAIMEKTFLVVVPFYPLGAGLGGAKKTATRFLPFLGGEKKEAKSATTDAKAKNDAEAAQDFKENAAQLNQRTGQVMSGLAGIGLEVTVLENDALIELFYNFYNPQTIERENITAPKE